MSVFSVSKSCLDECTVLLNKCILPEFKEGSERPLEALDFEQIKNRIEVSAKQLHESLNSDCNRNLELNSSEINEFLLLVLIHCGENFKESHWTSNNTYNFCNSLHSLVIGSEESRLLLFCEDHGKILKKLLLKLRPCLLSDTWKTYPTAVQCYVWCLNSLRIPYLGEHLDVLLPTALIITDDFIVDNKILGIKCLHHIINNTTLTELQARSHQEVIYKALEACLLQRDAELIPLLISCLLALLKKMYFLSTDHYSQWTHYDEVLSKFLYQLKLESNLSIKISMLDSLIKLISASGLISVRYLGNIIEIVDEALMDQSAVLSALKVIFEVLAICSPCVKHNLKQITFIVLKIMYSSSSYKPLAIEEIRNTCKCVLIRIHLSDSSLLQELTSADQFNQLNEDIRSIVQEVVNTS